MQSGSIGRGKILVVDDDANIRRSVSELLIESGYEVRAAVQGLAAIDLIVVARFRPDVIVLDSQMPAMDGKTFLEALEQIAESESIAIIGITAALHPPTEWRDRCLEILPKPFEGELLLAAVRRALRPGARVGGR